MPKIEEYKGHDPITLEPFFMAIGREGEEGTEDTYGGPFDSYTLSHYDEEDGWLGREKYDHDEGVWEDGGEIIAECNDDVVEMLLARGKAIIDLKERIK